MSRIPAAVTYLLVALVILAADLWTKQVVFELMDASIVSGHDGRPSARGNEISLIDGWMSFEPAANTGAFAGSFGDHPWFLVTVSVLAVAITAGIVLWPSRSPPTLVVSLGLLAGGAVGNLHDRFEHSAVRDFLKIYHWGHTWPNFNLADSAICTGVGLLFLREFLLWRRDRTQLEEKPQTPLTDGEQ